MTSQNTSRSASKFWPSPWLLCLPWSVQGAPERVTFSSSTERAARSLRSASAYRA